MPKRYSPGEEIANTSTHAVGILLGIVVGVAFVVTSLKGGDAWTGWSIGLYLFGMLSSYICSTAYHALPQGKAKQMLRKFDHAAIYWHIAGSYSPSRCLPSCRSTMSGASAFSVSFGVRPSSAVSSVSSIVILTVISRPSVMC